jgi:hypothetical protein
MIANDITNWTPEHEEAKRVFMEKYMFGDMKDSTELRLLREIIWEAAWKKRILEYISEGERKAHFKYIKGWAVTS